MLYKVFSTPHGLDVVSNKIHSCLQDLARVLMDFSTCNDLCLSTTNFLKNTITTCRSHHSPRSRIYLGRHILDLKLRKFKGTHRIHVWYIFTNMIHKRQLNVGKCTIHGWYGVVPAKIGRLCPFKEILSTLTINFRGQSCCKFQGRNYNYPVISKFQISSSKNTGIDF